MDDVLDLIFGRTVQLGDLRVVEGAVATLRRGGDGDPGQFSVLVGERAFVELDAYFKTVMDRGGSGDRLVQTFVTTGTHSYISDPTYPALVTSLLDWVETRTKPTPASVAQRCTSLEARFGTGCTFAPAYVPGALETRVPVS